MRLSNHRPFKIRPGLDEICGIYKVMLLGITGGIASGKSSISGMLEKKGMPVIDFDIIARQVVEPGQPAWHDILLHFGKCILTDNQKIDRKRLAGIVFDDREKRKRLEAITHPRITNNFIKAVNKTAQNSPHCIIQAVIPLLFEVSLEDLVHKILLVYIPREKQVERLIKRNGIKQDDAMKIISAQLPIEEKINMSDFVISNENSPEETGKDVGILYVKLQKAYKEVMALYPID